MMQAAGSFCRGLVVKDERDDFQAVIPDDLLGLWQGKTSQAGPTYSGHVVAGDRRAACPTV